MYKIPSINIGNRQSGRELSECVINVNYDQKKIIKAIQKISTPRFKLKVKNAKNIYYKKNTLENILLILERSQFKFSLKKFYDI